MARRKRTRVFHTIGVAMSRAVARLRSLLNAGRTPSDDPGAPPTFTQAMALREAARLSERVDAIALKRAA